MECRLVTFVLLASVAVRDAAFVYSTYLDALDSVTTTVDKKKGREKDPNRLETCAVIIV